jgi:hypothetical protein
MKIPRQPNPNRPNQSRIIFRADRDLRVAGGRRNEPMATLTRTICWSPWLCRGGESGWTESFGDVSCTTYIGMKIIWYPFFSWSRPTVQGIWQLSYKVMSLTCRICFIYLPIPVTGPNGPSTSMSLVLSWELEFYEISVALQKKINFGFLGVIYFFSILLPFFTGLLWIGAVLIKN